MTATGKTWRFFLFMASTLSLKSASRMGALSLSAVTSSRSTSSVKVYGRISVAFSVGVMNPPRSTYHTRQRHFGIAKDADMSFYHRFSTQLFSSEDVTNGEQCRTSKNINVATFKKEIARLSLRTHKKIGKVSTRIQAAQDQLQKVRDAMEKSSEEEVDDKLMEQLEQAPSAVTLEEFQTELSELQTRLQKLNWLEEQFNIPPLKKKSSLIPEELSQLLPENNTGMQILEYIRDLEIDEKEESKNRRIEEDANNKRLKKDMAFERQQQTQQEGSRLPYRRYYTKSRTEIRVGKQATDNDVLSLSPEHRSPSHWWYHASGCPGSHVVLCTDSSSPAEEDVLDAAALAALKSKCVGQSVIKVSMTRARNVSKPAGAKPGLVQLNGDVKTVVLRKDEVERRCERLEQTVVVN